MIIDATNMIIGRLGSFVAKKAILGETIDIINCEKAVITGSKEYVISKYKRKYDLGVGLQSPIQPRMPDRFVRRIIRGMLPYKQGKGKDAFARVMCYSGKPAQFEGKDILKSVPGADIKKTMSNRYVTVRDICRTIGGKVQ